MPDIEPIESLEIGFDGNITVDTPACAQVTSQSTLLHFNQQETESSEVSLDKIMEAISNLSLKVDNLGTQHSSLTQLAFEDDETRVDAIKIRAAENIVQLVEASKLLEWSYDEGYRNCSASLLTLF